MSINTDNEIQRLEAELAHLKRKLANSYNDFYNIIGKNCDGILICEHTGKIIYANPAALDLFGRDLGSLLGENIGIVIDVTKKAELTIVHKDRGVVTVEVNFADTHWNNKPAVLASIRDVTEHKKAKLLLEKLSHYDHLTDLANRVHFEETLKKSLSRCNRINKKLALLFLDMDDFKIVNDTYGHQVGDKLLSHTANLLKSCINQAVVISRLGGDEFAIILEQTDESNYYENSAKKILDAIRPPIKINNHEIKVNFSIGIAIYPDDAKSMDELMIKADKAMYHSKKTGRGRYHCYKENSHV